MDVSVARRKATEEDVERAIDHGAFQVPAMPAADLLAFFRAMIDIVVVDHAGERE
ncbi:hypothetical protein QUC32_28770 (plasmid) [Novosphingobium resinovorum]|jgi:hypothetical protein|uniref:hypothetical protein n=1 Tax=Sphingomonadaceae TaxID=41297 RepID=UPI0012EA218D|nr:MULTISPECIES: hypothetical protein [Sphingomonadaceae]MBF7015447.1 hypothetical protein [Novosphingobium sp. HR1a]MBF7015670.1 hypothetical protein [Novosphingobium sp. HR1a]WJM30126.1 hypothetical protein QUC32_27515 [Novosphingobium resinovorum]WJM30344.1 hypothetical protein QUC32_28770 [Novosphingobium resinovorum]